MMTENALRADRESGMPLVAVNKIYADSEFNSRGAFSATDIIEIAKDIAGRGLVEPIIVRPLWDIETELKAKGFEYSLVAGFRRYASYKVNKGEYIPAVIRVVASDFDARDINAVENLQRKDLSLWQEAKTIRHYWLSNWGREDTAARVGKSPGWVQLRFILLEMEPEIQNAADQGYIITSDIHELHKFTGKERLEVAGRLRDLRKSGQGKGVMDRLKKRDKSSAKRTRKAHEIDTLADIIRDNLKQIDTSQSIKLDQLISPKGNMLMHRIFAWITGEITTFDVHVDIRAFFRRIGHDYEMPEFAEE